MNGHAGNSSYDGTSSIALYPGLTMTFTFNGKCLKDHSVLRITVHLLLPSKGTYVAVYGITRPDSTTTKSMQAYVIDDNFPETSTQFVSNVTSFNVPFYQSPTLSPGEHTLVVTSVGDSSGSTEIDYVQYMYARYVSLEALDFLI